MDKLLKALKDEGISRRNRFSVRLKVRASIRGRLLNYPKCKLEQFEWRIILRESPILMKY